MGRARGAYLTLGNAVMSALITDCVKIGANAWRYEWTGTAPFSVMMGGHWVLTQSEQTNLIVQFTDGTHVEPPPIEVIDSTQDPATLQQVLYPPCPMIQFRGNTTCTYYIVSESVDGEPWANIATVVEDGRGYYTVQVSARATNDLRYRVTPYDMTGAAGDPLNFSFRHVTTMQMPDGTYTYNAGAVEIS